MAIYKTDPSDYQLVKIDGTERNLLSMTAANRFDASLLGLGDLSEIATSTDAIAAVFDLEGFTNFCKQIEPQLAVPVFLSEFLPWLVEQIKEVSIQQRHRKGLRLYSPLPFFIKFMGDGILVLWDASEMGVVKRRNIISLLHRVCGNYTSEFVPTMRSKVVDVPEYLRCGIARGTVFSVGNGNDFVGSCINMAARIQKLPGARFAFNRRGFDFDDSTNRFFKERVIVRKVSIRGIGENELIGIRKSEFDEMGPDDKALFRDP
jgi:class 3 adenylate cyclase